MTDKKLVVLGIIAVVMVILAVVTSTVPEGGGGEAKGPAYLMQGVDPANIGSIEIKSGEDVVTLKRKNGKFVVAEKSNYPATASKINDVISGVLDIKTIEMFTDRASNHVDLGVTDGAAAYIVKFFGPEGDEIAGVVVGKDKEQGQGMFVRRTSDDKVYVTLNRLYLTTKPVSYVDQTLVSAASDKLEWIKVADKQDGTYTLSKDDEGKLTLDKLPAGKVLNESEANAVFGALASLKLEDVVKEGTKELSFNKKYVCLLKDSTKYMVDIAAADGKTYVKCRAEFTDKEKITVKRGGNESEEELKAKEAKLLARDAVDKFNARHKGWIYQVPQYSANNMTKALDALFEVPTEEKTAPQKQPASVFEQSI